MEVNISSERIKIINKKIAGLKENGQSHIPPREWDRLYMQLKGIKGFWDDLTWDQILIECPELEWVKPIRADETFREYYKLKTDLDELMSLQGE